ncbi:25S rRNA (adenine645-N1)-methyltransferase [Marasmius crinis-equi]|uniref:Ribosomal RNA-processing protein 8 n=1 Tax=Marasmius crinis-equi TaxID=585013 RepID=A0ABR3G2L9_9AGAR
MPLFDVPGWSLSQDPVAESSTTPNSRKRKRPDNESVSEKKTRTAEVNLEKIVKTLTGKGSSSSVLKKEKKEKGKKGNKKAGAEDKKKMISHPMPLKGAIEKRNESTSSLPPAKKAKTKHEKTPSQESLVKPNKGDKEVSQSGGGLTSLQERMRQNLEGARFRWGQIPQRLLPATHTVHRLINELLYKNDSAEAQRLMNEDPTMYTDYHAGFRHQVQSWPTNPVDHFVSTLAKYPKKTVIADLGCGDAAIARNLIPEGMTVLSYDLKSDNSFVIEIDICGKLPLPGSEGVEGRLSTGEGHVVDVVVFSLSLMGTNWPNSIREAWRILKSDGELKIAEVASRFSDVKKFTTFINSIGFRLVSKDDQNTHFTLFEFKKIPRKYRAEEEWKKISAQGQLLKPCEYKRR